MSEKTTPAAKPQVNKTLRLTETAVMIAAAAVLSLIKIVDMPFGGSVTLFSMLPIAIISYRYGVPWGLLTGLVNALMQMMFGLKNLTYATSTAALIAIMLLDYIVAFVVIGLAGMFRGKIRDHGTALAFGTVIVCILRYICHVISGCTVWAGVSIPTSDGFLYSLAYNATYMIPETIVTVVGAFFVANILTLTTTNIKRKPFREESAVKLYTALPVSIGIVICFALICGMMQGESGFDITALGSADVWDWIKVATVLVVAIVSSVIVNVFLNYIKKTED